MSERDPGTRPEPAEPGRYEPAPEEAGYGEHDREAESSGDDSASAGAAGGAATDSGAEHPPAARQGVPNMLPARSRRRFGLERLVVRVVATGGIIGIGVAIAAILGANNVQAWITGLVVSALSVLLSAILWSSRQL